MVYPFGFQKWFRDFTIHGLQNVWKWSWHPFFHSIACSSQAVPPNLGIKRNNPFGMKAVVSVHLSRDEEERGFEGFSKVLQEHNYWENQVNGSWFRQASIELQRLAKTHCCLHKRKYRQWYTLQHKEQLGRQASISIWVGWGLMKNLCH